MDTTALLILAIVVVVIAVAAFLAIGIFLARNGHGFYAGKVDSIVKILGLAAGELTEDELASWIREYMDS